MDERLEAVVASVPGWLTRREAKFLYSQARRCPRSAAIVEIGSYKGRSTICLAKGAEAGLGACVFAIDHHVGEAYGDFIENLKRIDLLDRVTPIRKSSREACREWSKPIGLLFIDGDHDHAMVEQDFLLWSPHVIEGGVIAVHDSTSSPSHQLMGYLGPKRVVDKYILGSSLMSKVGRVDTTTFASKGEVRGWVSRLARLGVRIRKLFPDALLYLYHYLIVKLPMRVLASLRAVLYGAKNRKLVVVASLMEEFRSAVLCAG